MAVISETGKALFKQALVDFRLNPESHKQQSWICKTGCCLAGSVVLQAGGQPLWDTYVDVYDRELVSASTVVLDGVKDTIPLAAIGLLGVSSADSAVLFEAANTIDHLEAMYRVLDSGSHLVEYCPRCGFTTSTRALQDELNKGGLDNNWSHWSFCVRAN